MRNGFKEAKILAARIASVCLPEKIILYGSFARGEKSLDSDIDLLIVKKSDKKRPFRVKEIFMALRGMKRDYPLDVIVYTPQELANRISLGDTFLTRVLSEGKILYERK